MNEAVVKDLCKSGNGQEINQIQTEEVKEEYNKCNLEISAHSIIHVSKSA